MSLTPSARGPAERTWTSGMRLRSVVAVAAGVLAVALAAVPLIGATKAAPVLWALAGVAVLATLLGLLGLEAMLTLALFSLAAELLTRQLAHGLEIAVAIGYGVGLLAVCELAAFAGELSRRVHVERAVAWRRAGWVGVTLLLGGMASALALLGGSLRLGDALVAVGIGVPAALVLVAGVYALTPRGESI